MATTRTPPLLADRTVQLLREGYLFLPRLRWEQQSDIVPLRLLGRPAVAVYGPAGAELIYQRQEIRREGAVPERIQKTLFGRGGVQSLDGSAHRHRKEMFMQVVQPDRLKQLRAITAERLRSRAERWFGKPKMTLLRAAEEVLMEAGAAWAGVPLAGPAVRRRARQMALMVDSFAALGPRHWAGRLVRTRSERWMASVVARARAGELEPPAGSALEVIANYRDPEGNLLLPQIAAVELLNVIRPLVAVGRFVAFTGLALYEHGGEPATDEDLEHYVHEVRRFYPFVPFIGGRVETAFDWQDVRFPAGATVLLDVYGMNHDAGLWDRPQRFRPERFRERAISPYDFVPQGGGDFYLHHRCAGEDATIGVMMEFTRFLSREVVAEVPPQDLTVDLGRIPAAPASGFVLANPRPRMA